MFDTHCHLQFKSYQKDLKDVLKRCDKKDLIMNVVGTQKDTSFQAVKLAEQYKNIYATVGLHPIHLISTDVDEEEITFKSREEEFDYEFYKKLANNKKVIGIGECGIELFHLPKNIEKKEALEKQKKVFLSHHNLSKEMDLPLVIHVRDAHSETLEILNSLKEKINGVIHCYTSNWNNAKKYLDLGLYIGFTGISTFPPKKLDPKPQEDLLEVLRKCPLDRMLIETDSPYLAPQKYRGKRCEPWMVEEVIKKIAEVKKNSLEDVLEQTDKNTRILFKKIK